MYRTVIIDDDELARRVLSRILKQVRSEIELLGEADSVASGIQMIEELKPNLVFLDIDMPDGTGFDLIEKLNKVNFKLIFATSYSDYAIRAFKYSAFDYILKPVLAENVLATIERLPEIPVLDRKEQIQSLHESFSRNHHNSDHTIALPELNGFAIIQINSIVRCEGERNYTRVFYRDGSSVLISRTLLDFDQLLVDKGFFRIHRSHLINLNCVHRYLKTDGGVVEMCDKSVLRISPKFKDELLEKLLANRL